MARRRLSDDEAKKLGIPVKKKLTSQGNANPRYDLNDQQLEKLNELRGVANLSTSDTQSNSYANDKELVEKPRLSAIHPDGRLMDIDEYCDYWGLPREDVTSYKLVSHTGDGFYNIVFKEEFIGDAALKLDFSAIVKSVEVPVLPTGEIKNNEWDFDKLVLTDIHVGMDPNPENKSLYGGKWDREELLKRADIVVNHVIDNQKSDVLVVDQLGDLMDGWDGFTVKKSHKLPQNMTNQQASEAAIAFLMRVIDGLVPQYMKIHVNNAVNSNHGGDFDAIICDFFKEIAEYRYSNVKVHNHQKFISHYVIKDWPMMICHGKDDGQMKFGMGTILTPQHVEKIKYYIDEHKLHTYKHKPEFHKGDTHMKLYDEGACDHFGWYNHPAFSPPSGYVQVNFKKSLQGFDLISYREDGQKAYAPYIFPFESKREDEILILEE